MTTVLACITIQHDIRLVLLAAVVCVLGAWVSVQLFVRARASRGRARLGWLMMDAVAAGSATWTTHFVAMLAYDPGVPTTFDPVLTLASLLVAIAGMLVGTAVALGRTRLSHLAGGALVGGAVAAMHYTGMAAYRVDGLVSYDPPFLVASVVLAVALASLAYSGICLSATRACRYAASGLLALTIVTLHFTGMAAVSVTPMDFGVEAHSGATELGVGIAGVGLLVLAAAFSGYMVDSATGEEGALRLRRLADATTEGLAVVENGEIVAVNRPFEALVGLDAASIVGRPATDFFDEPPPGALACGSECLLRVPGADPIMVELTVRDGVMGAGTRVFAVRDVRQRIAQEQRIRFLAMHDALTGLPNRPNFTNRLGSALADLADGERLALLAIDLDGFKEVNDLRGHAAGDAVLVTVAARMASVLGRDEFLARIGGDEFAALRRFSSTGEVLEFAERLRAALMAPIVDDGIELSCGGSIGIAIYPDDADVAGDLTGKADLAMYRAKRTVGPSVIAFYREEMDEIVRHRRQLAHDLRGALAAGQLELRYQVQSSVETRAVTGYEVLLRWRHPVYGYVPPAEFIPVAEETGLILPIGEWVLRTAAATAARWATPHRIAVNLSPVQLSHQDLPRLVHEVLQESGLPATRLELEITESMLVSDPVQTLCVLQRIKSLGVSVAMDDFGTGYSSLSTLRSFPFDKIKLDRSFMGEFETNAQARAIIRAVLALGRSLDIPILAEGVETGEQLDFLRQEGCDEAQGYLLGRPVVMNEFSADDDMRLSA